MQNNLGLHESLELHELLMLKGLCVTKSATMQKLVKDERLKQLMQEDVESSARHVEDLKNHLENGRRLQ